MNSLRYITKIKIENFQNHADNEIEFKPGINLIIGSSDAGKSAVLRAINLVFHNIIPRRTNFVRHGADYAQVTIWFSDGNVVTRLKGPKRNAVHLTKPDGQQLAFEKIGSELPIEIIEAMGNPPMDERHGPVCYSKQMDPLFLTALTSTELPRAISELTGIDDFEEAAATLGKKSNQAKKDVKDVQERIADCDTELEKYVRLDEQLEELIDLEKNAIDIDDKYAIINDIEEKLSRYSIIINTGRITNRKLKLAKAISEYKDDLLKAGDVKKILSLIDQMLSKHNTLQSKEHKLLKDINICSKIALLDASVCSELSKQICDINSAIGNHSAIMIKGSDIHKKYTDWISNHNSCLSKKKKIISEMKEQGLWCNNCDRPLTESKKEHSCE